MMALDTLTGMTVFRHAIEEGSLAAAARRTGMSAEMAGRHLKALEARLGVRLVNRSTRKLSLTEAGQAYFRRCVAILDEIALAEADAGTRQAEPRGQLRVAAPLAFSNAVLGPAVADYMRRYPGVTLTLDLSERETDLLGEGFDVALRLGTLPDTAMIARRLGGFPLILTGAPGYFRSRNSPEHPEDLREHRILAYMQTATPERFVLSDAAGHRVQIAFEAQLRATDAGFLVTLALLGRGLVLAPSFLVMEHIAEGRLVHVLPEWSARTLPLHAIIPHRTLMPATVRSFIDVVAEWVGAS
ncbi:LysR family transcriptional regulator [Azospirillum sp. A1-3]|uniref:LysR family transcriptional regulator n=1 Tax=Azospirillum sp. A1-3 TaxID=185874 RepID=UPI00207763AB|nr:LysR family transcriptional regulator [Azospirillum sp. A1-3]MCM8737594.1 LysR family transcriptional regulator [Azospirillum sp. A1-3]